jgi:hypothetical protein
MQVDPQFPKHHAFWPKTLFEDGIDRVLISRFRSGGQRIETGVFLVEVRCLGAKNAVYEPFLTPLTYEREVFGALLP